MSVLVAFTLQCCRDKSSEKNKDKITDEVEIALQRKGQKGFKLTHQNHPPERLSSLPLVGGEYDPKKKGKRKN